MRLATSDDRLADVAGGDDVAAWPPSGGRSGIVAIDQTHTASLHQQQQKEKERERELAPSSCHCTAALHLRNAAALSSKGVSGWWLPSGAMAAVSLFALHLDAGAYHRFQDHWPTLSVGFVFRCDFTPLAT